MSSCGLIDAVLTSDADIFMFGAQCVLRACVKGLHLSVLKAVLTIYFYYRTSLAQSPTSSKEEFYIYTADALENVNDIQLTQGGVILIVLLSGGDYHDGMQGCGLAITHALARCGFGDHLLGAFNSMARDAFFRYLRHNWADELSTELRTNSRGFLRTRQPQLAIQLSTFLLTLDQEDVEKYVSPLTSWSGLGMAVDMSGWVWQAPNVTTIAEFCFTHLGWTDTADLIRMLRNNLWEGVVHRILLSVSHIQVFIYGNIMVNSNSSRGFHLGHSHPHYEMVKTLPSLLQMRGRN